MELPQLLERLPMLELVALAHLIIVVGGPTTQCSTCVGTGYRCGIHPNSQVYKSQTDGYYEDYGGCGQSTFMYWDVLKCPDGGSGYRCGIGLYFYPKIWTCSSCGRTVRDPANPILGGVSTTCSICGGSGSRKQNCSHGKSGAHYYCSHNNNGTSHY